jgi:hypothetical protein
MYLASTFIDQKIPLNGHKEHGPDIKFLVDGKVAWCEAIAVERGNGEDAVPEMYIAKKPLEVIVQSVPEEKMILRLTSGIYNKHKKYLGYLKKGVIQDGEPYVIGINRYGTNFIDPPNCPLILKAVFGVGYATVSSSGRKSWTRRSTLKRQNKDPIGITFFENPDYSGISAIIYETRHIINLQGEKVGHNLILVHNPLADNPMPRNFLSVKEEY